MKIGMIGLGRMGGNIARRLMRGGHEVVAFDRDAEAVGALVADGRDRARRRSTTCAASSTRPRSAG